jgi:hypothetical protein
MSEKKKRISTFSKSMTPEEAQREMKLGTPVGRALLRAEKSYQEYAKKRKALEP